MVDKPEEVEYDFEEEVKKNKETKNKQQKDRGEANKKVKREYRL